MYYEGWLYCHIFAIILCLQGAKGINPLPLKGLGHGLGLKFQQLLIQQLLCWSMLLIVIFLLPRPPM